jgi:hypothetical protein
MPEKEIITLDEAQTAAERFLEERLKGLKKLAIDRVQLSSVEHIVVYEIQGIAMLNGFLFRTIERPFKIQVAAADGAIVGYET